MAGTSNTVTFGQSVARGSAALSAVSESWEGGRTGATGPSLGREGAASTSTPHSENFW